MFMFIYLTDLSRELDPKTGNLHHKIVNITIKYSQYILKHHKMPQNTIKLGHLKN